MVDRDPISGALYSGALTLDPLWNTSERCAGGDLGITARLLFTVPVQAACVFSISAMADAWLGYPAIG